MKSRDPLVPLLAVASAVVVLGGVLLVFYPRISVWMEARRPAIVGTPPAPHAPVPVWVTEREDGVALMLVQGCDAGAARLLDGALEGGPHHYLSLTVYNFACEEPYVLDLGNAVFASPEGGQPARAAASVVRSDAPATLRAVLTGLGAVPSVRVEKGHAGTVLLVLEDDPARRTAFQWDDLRLERRQLERRVLASWQQRPEWKEFRGFRG